MIDTALRNQVLGYYSIPSAIAVIDAPFRERRALQARLGLSADELQGELTRRHEFAHYRQIMSTPFGILLWRCFNSLICDIEHIAVDVSGREPMPRWQPPLHSWVLAGGLPPAPHDPRYLYLLHVCAQVDALQNFLGALIGAPAGLTVGAFLQTCQQAIAEICERSDLRCTLQFKSRRDPSEPLYGPGVLSGVELMEAATRLEERLLLQDLPDSTAQIERWEKTAIFGVYEPGYRWLLAETGDAQVALALIDVAFMTPFDPAFLQGSGGEVFIEDLLPALRLPRLVQEAKRHFWSNDPQALDRLMGSTLCEAIGLESPQSIATRGATAAYNGPRSWGTDFAKQGGPAHLDPALVFNYFDSECRRAMQLRAASPSAVHREPYTTNIAFRPAIIFYRDAVVFGVNDLEQRENGILLVAALFRKFLYDAQILGAIGMPAEHDADALRGMLWQRLSTRHPRGDWIFETVDAWRQQGINDDTLRDLFFGRSLPLFAAAGS